MCSYHDKHRLLMCLYRGWYGTGKLRLLLPEGWSASRRPQRCCRSRCRSARCRWLGGAGGYLPEHAGRVATRPGLSSTSHLKLARRPSPRSTAVIWCVSPTRSHSHWGFRTVAHSEPFRSQSRKSALPTPLSSCAGACKIGDQRLSGPATGGARVSNSAPLRETIIPS